MIFLNKKILVLFCFFCLLSNLGFSEKTINVGLIISNEPPSKPNIVNINDLYGINNITLSWSSYDYENDDIKYFLQMGSLKDLNDILDINLDSNYYNLTLNIGKEYFYKIKACDNYYGDYNNCSVWAYDSFYLLSIIINPPSSRGGGNNKIITNVSIFGCKDLNGFECNANEVCYDSTINTYDSQNCCFSKCINKELIGKLYDLNYNFQDLNLNSNLNITIPIYSNEKIDFINKRILTDYEIEYKLMLKRYGIYGLKNNYKYRNYVFVSITNISNFNFQDVDLIINIPEEYLLNSENISSNNLFSFLDNKNLKYILGDVDTKQTKTVNYYFDSDLNDSFIYDVFLKMKPPIALTKMDKEDLCLGVKCNDLNPCTTDFCMEGLCYFSNLPSNYECENGFCSEGKCIPQIEESKQSSPKYLKYILWGLLFIFIFVIIILLFFRLFKRKKEEHKWYLLNNIRIFK